MKYVSGQTQACASGVQKWVINDSVQAASLISATKCFGGNFEVEWNGRVQVEATILVLGGTIMKITGSGDAFMDGGGNTHIFYVYDSELYLEDVIVGNGNGSDGGAVYSIGSTLSFVDTHFVGNKAFGDGGAVHVSDSRVSCEGSTFFNNTAESKGGAMFSVNSTIVCGGSWVGNSAEASGAIRLGDGSTLSWSEDTIFDSNSASVVGGAISVLYGSSVSWEDCITLFYNNTIDFYGGSIYSESSYVSVGGTTTFDSNQVHGGIYDGTFYTGWGGGLDIRTSVVVFSGVTTFTNNTSGFGGAISISESELSVVGELMMTNNHALKAGGCFYTVLSTISSSIDSVNIFMSNYADGFGGAFGAYTSDISLSGSTKIYNNSDAFVLLYSSSLFWQGEMEISHNSHDAVPYGDGNLVDFFIVTNSTLSWKGNTVFKNNYGTFLIQDGSNVFWSEGYTQFVGNNHSNTNIGIFGGSSVSWSGETDFVENQGSNTIYVGDVFGDANERVDVLSKVGRCSLSWSGNTRFVDNSATSTPLGGFGGVMDIQNADVSWDGKTEFIGNTANLGGAIGISEGAHLSWTGETEFSSNEAVSFGHGGAIVSNPFIGSDNLAALVINGPTVFSENKAQYGGAIHLSSSVLLTVDPSVDVSFVDNSAAISGGALYLVSVGSSLDIVEIENVRFLSNSALDGGAIHSVGSFLKITGCNFIENSAVSFGGALSSASGNDIIYNSVFEGNSAGTGGAIRTAGETIINGCSFVENYSDEGQGSAVSNIGIMRDMSTVSFSMNTFDCSPGTFLEYIASEDSLEVTCVGCGSCIDCVIEDHVPTCTDIFDHSESYGGNTTLENISISEGFWRATSTSRDVLQCHNEDACIGGVTGSDDYCEEGYEGPYCSICSEGYSEHLSFSCRECSDDNTDTIIAAAILSVVGLIVVIMLAYYLTSSETDSNVGLSGVMKRYIPLQSLKIVVVTWQILNQFSSVANVVYPGIYQDFLDGLDFFNFDFSWIMSAGCIVRIDFHDRLLLSTICPIVALAFLACTYTVASYVNRGKKDVLQRIDDKHMSMVLLLTFLVYSSVSSVLFKAFACEDMDDDKYYLRADYRIECDSSEHASYQLYAGIMIVVYTLGIPAMYCYLLFRDRDVLKTSDSSRGLDSSRVEAISDLWEPYRSNVFYYEIVECIRRVLLSSVVVFIYPNTAAQIAITILISFSFVVIFEAMAPYVSSWDRWISRLGQVVIFMSMYMALLLKVDVSGERYGSQEIFEETLIAVHVLMVLAVIVESIVTLCYLKHAKVEDLDEPQPLPRFNVEEPALVEE